MSSWTFGRADDCDVVLEDGNVSERHCRLTRDGDRCLLEDLQSSNGTFVNGLRIVVPTVVTTSDNILLADAVPLPWPYDALPETQSRERPQTISDRGPGTMRATVEGEITIGRDPESGFVVVDPRVSWNHARLVMDRDGRGTLKDVGSVNKTYVNTQETPIEEVEISRDDVLFFGSYRVPAGELFDALSNQGGFSPPEPRQALSLTVDRPLVIGRDPNCDQMLDHPMVSWRHLKLMRSRDGFVVEDLDSTNGTFLNGDRINGRASAQVGDVVTVASFSITLTAGGPVEAIDARGRYSVEARNISIDVPGKRLLENISLTIHPGEFVGLMGPSGAGKSTLMNALNGYIPPDAGAVLISGRNLYEQYDMFRGQIGYVPQDDIMHGELTVSQALFYTARLRLPPDFSDAEIHKRIGTVLEQLDLRGTDIKTTLIGSPEKKGISGGQRKRVNLAMELLTDPSILFLDEPTSGLSSEDALTVMNVLRKLADGGTTILLTIHQPSLEAYRLMDHLVVVARDTGPDAPDVPGCLAWYGPAYPDAIRFFNPEDTEGAVTDLDLSPDGVLRGLKRRSAMEWSRRYNTSSHHKKFVVGRQSEGSIPPLPARKTIEREFGFRQAWTLIRRGLTIRLSDRANTILLMAQTPYIAVLIMMAFGADARQDVTGESWPSVARAMSMTCFLLGLSALWCGCSNAVREIVGEWAIYRRERMVNLKIPSYIVSKVSVLMGLSAIQCFCLLLMVSLTNGLKGSFMGMFIVMLLACGCGNYDRSGRVGIVADIGVRRHDVAARYSADDHAGRRLAAGGEDEWLRTTVQRCHSRSLGFRVVVAVGIRRAPDLEASDQSGSDRRRIIVARRSGIPRHGRVILSARGLQNLDLRRYGRDAAHGVCAAGADQLPAETPRYPLISRGTRVNGTLTQSNREKSIDHLP